MKTLLTLATLSLLMFGCNVEQEATEWGVTRAPQAGPDRSFETNMNEPIAIQYEMQKDDKVQNMELVIKKSPKNGKLQNCEMGALSMKCVYVPNENFVGEDVIYFKTVNGDFESEEYFHILITVNAIPGGGNGGNDDDVAAGDDDDDDDDTGSGGGGPGGGGYTPPEYEEVVVKCDYATQNAMLLTQTVNVNFPAAIECNFNEDGDEDDPTMINLEGNGPRKNSRVRARREQFVNIALPNNGIVCDMDFNFPLQQMQYDDEIFLTLNNIVLMSSQNYSIQSGDDRYDNGLLVNAQGLMEYKWAGPNGLYNLYYDQGVTPKYCLGISPMDPMYNEKCNLPKTETAGQIKLDIPASEIIKVGVKGSTLEEASGENQLAMNFGFITTGDNDNGDCEHAAYGFTVEVKYFIQDQQETPQVMSRNIANSIIQNQ